MTLTALLQQRSPASKRRREVLLQAFHHQRVSGHDAPLYPTPHTESSNVVAPAHRTRYNARRIGPEFRALGYRLRELFTAISNKARISIPRHPANRVSLLPL